MHKRTPYLSTVVGTGLPRPGIARVLGLTGVAA
jgi:hypothetical protein